jgi:hypothetical protein
MSYRQSSSNREADGCVIDRAAQTEKQVAMFFIQQLKQRSRWLCSSYSSSNSEADGCVIDRAAQKEKQVAMFFIQQLKQRSR